MAVILASDNEDALYGFHLHRTTDKPDQIANLNTGNAASVVTMLCTQRGGDAVVVELGVRFPDKHEPVPPGWHQCIFSRVAR